MQNKHQTPHDLRKERPQFRVKPHSSGYLPGVDQTKFNQLVDELEVEEFIGKHRDGFEHQIAE